MDKEVQQSISDTINYLKQRINDISKESEGSHNYQNLIDKIAQKSIRTLKATSDSLKKSAKEFKDSKEATQSLNFLKEKAKASRASIYQKKTGFWGLLCPMFSARWRGA